MNYFVSIFVMLFVINVELRAENARWSVSPNPCLMGDTIEISLEIEGELKSEIEIPQIKGLSFQGQSQSTQVSIVNGNFSKSNTQIFSYVCEEEGETSLAAMEFEFKGGIKKSTSEQKIKVLSSGASAGGRSQGGAAVPQGDNGGASLQLSLERRLKNKEVYVGQVLKSSLVLLHNYPVRNLEIKDGNAAGVVIKRENDPDKMAIKSIQDPSSGSNGIEIPEVIFLDRSGKVEIPSTQILMQAQTPTRDIRRQRRSMLDDFFGDDSFFGGAMGQRFIKKSLKSSPISIQVLDLPKEGKPSNFSGAVGEYEFSIQEEPMQDVQQGSSLNLKFTLKGKGDLTGVRIPKFFESEDFQTFYEDPDTKASLDENGDYVSRVEFTVVVVFKKAGSVSLGSLGFDFFSPDNKKYIEKKLGSFNFNVIANKDAPNQDPPSSASKKDSNEAKPANNNLNSEQSLNSKKSNAYWSWWWIVGVGFAIGVLIFLVFNWLLKKQPERSTVPSQKVESVPTSKIWQETLALQKVKDALRDLKAMSKDDLNFEVKLRYLESWIKTIFLKLDLADASAKTWFEIQDQSRLKSLELDLARKFQVIFERYFFGDGFLDTNDLFLKVDELLNFSHKESSIVRS